MKKFIIIEHEPLTVRLKGIWNIEALIHKGVDVEYWDMSSLIFPDVKIPDEVDDKYVRVIDNLEYFNKLILANDALKTIYALEIFLNWENRKIIKILQDNNCACVKIDLYANTTIPRSIVSRTISYLKRFSLPSFIKKVLWYYYKTFRLKQIYNLVLSSSSLAFPDICINHPDYEKFQQNECPLITEPYILFIDAYYPLHPDWQYIEKNCEIQEVADNYRHLMADFFDFLKKKYHIDVIIAAHPKSNYTGGEFGEHKIIKGQTCNLVKFANQIVMHESNSLSFIVLADKPFVIVYPETYSLTPVALEYINNLASYCGKTAYNLNKTKWDALEFSKPDSKFRQYYVYNFLTSVDTEHAQNTDIWIAKLLTE